jgi:flagellar hook-associated protein 2
MSTSSLGSSSTAPVVSVASTSTADSAGGSVINVSSLVSQLVAATQNPQQTLIDDQESSVTTQISSLGTLKSALSTFQSSLAALDTPSSFQIQTATSSDQTAFTATASSGAPAGTYTVGITQLASAQQLLSGAISDSSLGTGTLTLSLGGTSFNVQVASGDNTLADIAAAINGAAGNPGISATVMQGANGNQLLLSSSQTGAANAIQVTESDGGTGLAALTYGTGNTGNYTQESAAQDAKYSISGVNFTSASNTVTSGLSGVTLDLLTTTTASTPATLSIGTDTSTIESNVQALVTAYNTLQTTFSQLGGYDSATQTAGPMMGNAVLTGIKNQVQNALYSVINTGSPTYNTLASVGITTNSDGSLSLNSATLQNALSTNFSSVSQLFSGTNGVASQLNSDITEALGATGSITEAGTTLESQETALQQQSTQLSEQMTALTASLTQQYSQLNSLLSSLQSTSSYLQQAFATLPQVQSTQSA